MNNNAKLTVVGICLISMSSCALMDDDTAYQSSSYVYTYDNSQSYIQRDYSVVNYEYYRQPKQDVVVPDSYHVGELHSPVTFKDRDRTWVNGQNPQAYTIELADGERASQVAQKLYKAPKNDRMAQVKYLHAGKDYYKGVYGSYKSAEEAQKALDALPPDVKNGSTVKSWGSVQGNLIE